MPVFQTVTHPSLYSFGSLLSKHRELCISQILFNYHVSVGNALDGITYLAKIATVTN